VVPSGRDCTPHVPTLHTGSLHCGSVPSRLQSAGVAHAAQVAGPPRGLDTSTLPVSVSQPGLPGPPCSPTSSQTRPGARASHYRSPPYYPGWCCCAPWSLARNCPRPAGRGGRAGLPGGSGGTVRLPSQAPRSPCAPSRERRRARAACLP